MCKQFRVLFSLAFAPSCQNTKKFIFPNSEYDKPPVNDDLETEGYKFECWDPDNKWEVQDVYNHMEIDIMNVRKC